MNKPFMLSVIMLSGIMLSVDVLNVIFAKKLMGHLMVLEKIKIFCLVRTVQGKNSQIFLRKSYDQCMLSAKKQLNIHPNICHAT